jgi:hypothetical protein
MNVVDELEQILTLDQAERLVESDLSWDVSAASSTQRLLDELLGRFEEDDLPMHLAHGIAPEFYIDSEE